MVINMVHSIISELSDDLFDEYMYASKEEVDMLRLQKLKEPEDVIIELIGDYNTLKLLLIREEYALEKDKIGLESELYHVQKQLMEEEGLKITEAKAKAKNVLLREAVELELDKEKDIALLKASIHSIEYQLRLQFKRMNNDDPQCVVVRE